MPLAYHRASPLLRLHTFKKLSLALSFRHFHVSTPHLVVKPFLLADIGEGITECQVIQWFVQPGARVEQFDKLCEVQSDKASVEITSPYDGVVTRLYHEPDDMAVTGMPLVDIDVQGEVGEEEVGGIAEGQVLLKVGAEASDQGVEHPPRSLNEAGVDHQARNMGLPAREERRYHQTLATPAVRHLTKKHDLDIADIEGTGKDGRVLKEDVQLHMALQSEQSHLPPSTGKTAMGLVPRDQKVLLSPIQMQMFRTMTRSLQIPHFLYSSTAEISSLTRLRQKLNASAESTTPKLTHLPFVVKAVSLAFAHHPVLNSSLNTKDPKKPEVTQLMSHNFGVAIDTPTGLVVPVIKNVQDLNITEIASILRQLSDRARTNRLSPQDFSGASFTISNIGSIGGGVVSPVISEPQVAILGVGRSRFVPGFDTNDELIKKEELVLSWSADHRVVDGAECARTAEKVRSFLEEPAAMMVEMR